MNTKLVLAAASLLAFCPPLHAQTPSAVPPSASPAAPAAAPVTLRYKFAVGQTRRYRLDTDMNMLMATGQTGAGVPIEMTMEMVMRQTVKSVRSADGAATLTTQIEAFHMLRNGQSVPLPDAEAAKMKQPFTQVMLPTGKILSMEMPALKGMSAPGMDFGKGMFTTALLPDGPVKIGDQWSGAVDAAMAGVQTTFTATLASLDTKDGVTLATIQNKQSGTIAKTLSQGMPVTMKMQGQLTGTATQVFDTTAGTIRSATGTSGTDMTMTFGKAADGTLPPGMPSAMKMQMQMKFMMQRLSDTPPTATAPVQ